MPLSRKLKMWKKSLLVLWILMVGSVFLWAKDAPFYIQSDQMEIDHNKRVIVFTGHVKARQKDILVQADLMRVYYKATSTQGKETKDISKQQIERIEAEGHVIINQGERQARGEKAVFLKDREEIILTGHPVLQEGGNVIKGEKVVIF